MRERVSWAQEWIFATGMEITRWALATRLETRIVPRLVEAGTPIQAGESDSREVRRVHRRLVYMSL
jgi:hypothetical protein